MAVRPITDVLRDLRYGEALEEANTKFNELVKAVENAGRPGEFIMKIKLKPSTAGAIEVTDEITIKTPAEMKGTSLFFPTVEGNLVKNDPRQSELPGLKIIEQASNAPLKEVGNV